MSLKTTVIGSFARFLLGGDTFERIKAIVVRQEDKNLSGSQKREAAIEEIKLIGLGIANFLVGLGIELAVTYLRSLDNKYK